MERGERSRHPVQTLLEFAEQAWGPRFDSDGRQLWWCDDQLDPNYLVVTNGVEYFLETEVGVLKVDIREDGVLVAVSLGTIRTPEDAQTAYMQTIWG
jgi:hypothetical protein